MANLYQHHKGGRYELVDVGLQVEQGADEPIDVVVYRSLDTGQLWIRSAAEFFGMVKILGLPNAVPAPSRRRFEPVAPPRHEPL